MEKTYKILKLLIWVLAFAVVLVGAYTLYNHLSSRMEKPGLAVVTEATAQTEAAGSEESADGKEPMAAPDFTVCDRDGNPHKLSDFRGKPVILNFWASWCGPCISEMPAFQECYETYGNEIHFLMVNLTDGAQETVETASQYIAEHGYTFPVYYDTDMEGAYSYGVSAVPVSYFLDAQGNFVTWAQGALSAELLQQGVNILLG